MELKDIESAVERATNGLKESVNAIIDTKMKGTSDEVVTLKKSLSDVAEQNEKLIKAAKEQAEKINELTRAKGSLAEKRVEELLRSEDVKKSLSEIRIHKQNINFEMKADPSVVSTGSISPSTASGHKLSLLGANGELFYINRAQGESILDAVTLTNVDKASITYVDEVEGNGEAGDTAENTPKNQLDVSFQEVIENATKKTGFVKVTTEMLDDVSYTSEAIRRVIDDKLDIKIQNDVLTGIISKATTYDLTDFDAKVEKASMMDAINAAIAQSMKSGFVPTTIVLNPIDVISLRFIKSTSGTPIINYFNEGKIAMLNNGLTIRMSKLMKQGDFVLGDMSRYRVMMYKRSINIGLDADDFTNNRVTILAEARYIKMCSTNEKATFVKGTFETIITKLNKPEAVAAKA